MNENETYADPLGLAVDLNEVSTLRPTVKDGQYAATIDSKIDVNAKKTGHNLVVQFKLLADSESLDSKPIGAGFSVTRWYALQQSDNPKAPKYEADIVRLMDAALNVKQGTRPAIKSWTEVPSLINGREVTIAIKTRKDDNEQLQNDVTRVMPAVATA